MSTVGVKPKVGPRRVSTAKALRYKRAIERQQARGPGYKLNFVDFVPKCLETEGLFNAPKFERFDVLVERANRWLTEHPNVCVRTCETIEIKSKYGVDIVDTSKSTFYEQPSKQRTQYVRGLRIWVAPHVGPMEPQRIRYFNVLPCLAENEKTGRPPKFETFAQTVERVNDTLTKNPLNGRLVTVETQEVKYKELSQGLDPDKNFWTENSGKYLDSYLVMVRIFYISGAITYEEIGCADFIPEYSELGYETFQSVVNRASVWLSQQHSIHLTSIQAIKYKTKIGEPIDTQRSFYTHSMSKGSKSLQILRLYLTKPTTPVEQVRIVTPAHPPQALTYKTFFPVQLTRAGRFMPARYENQIETMKRVIKWLQLTDVDIVAAETIRINVDNDETDVHSPDELMYNYEYRDENTNWLFVLRIYFNGYYIEPSPSDLLPIPPIKHEQEECCRIL